MNPTATMGESGRVPKQTRAQMLSLTVAFFAVMAILLFGAAGRLDVPAFWAYIILLAALTTGGITLVYRRSPDLIEERLHPGPGEQDHVTVPALAVATLVHWLIAGYDVGRLHWSDNVPMVLKLFGLLAVGAGMAFAMWATISNRFFSSAVRLQADRGQYVVKNGPYAYVRHPGYSGSLVFLLASGLALGSWLAIIPMIVAAAVIIWRTDLEDRMLTRGLPGYNDYKIQVPYRLVPGVW